MRLRILPVILGALLLVGAGCSRQPSTTSTNTDTSTTTTKNGSVNGTKVEEKIKLTGTITGPNSIELEWSPNDDTLASAEKWMIIEGSEENPEYPTNYRYYFLRDKPYRNREWKSLPTGTSHFRVCAFVDNVCTTYSNDLVLEIPGRVPGTK